MSHSRFLRRVTATTNDYPAPHAMSSTHPHRSKYEIINDIEALTLQPGFLNVLTILCCRDLLVDTAEVATRNWHGSLSYQELALLCGLLVKHTFGMRHRSADAVALQVSNVDELFAELHHAYMPPPLNNFETPTATAPTQLHRRDRTSGQYGMGDFFTESFFYAGSGAYDFQYLDLAARRYEADDQWIVQERGFSIETACAIASQLKSLFEARLQEPKSIANFADACDHRLDLFSFHPREITVSTPAIVDAFLDAFSLEPGNANPDFNIYGDYNAFEARPIIRLDDGRHLLLVHFLLAQSIYESPFYWMSADSVYRDTAFVNRGRATTAIAHEMLARVFGDKRVFRDVRVMRNKRETVTDIDILAFVGNKAVVIQAKSKKLTLLARRGSEDRLRADFKAAIQDGYDQAVTCRRALLDRNHTLLTGAGDELRLEESLDEVYLGCVTSDNYPGLSLQTTHLLEKTEGDPTPIAISLFDLDVLTFYVKDPFDFVYYQRQRAATADHFIADNELVLLAHHLSGLLRRNAGYDISLVDASCAQWIDSDFPAAHGHAPVEASATKVKRWENKTFKLLLDCLKNSGIPGFTDAVFMLLGLSPGAADQLSTLIESTTRETAADGKRHSFGLSLGPGNDQGLSFVCMTDTEELAKDVFAYGVLKKHQLQADQWLSLGRVSGSTNVIDVATFTKEPWKPDAKLDALSRRMKPRRAPAP